MAIPDPLNSIASDVLAGKVRRAKVRTLMGYYSLKRRREAGLYQIRQDLTKLGISTDPPFESAEFDDQVKFIPLGQEPSGTEATEETPAGDYAIEPVAGQSDRYRVLQTSFDATERFMQYLVGQRLARVIQQGQNPRRQDRDIYPFFSVVDLKGKDVIQLEDWLREAGRLGEWTKPSVEPEVKAPEAEVASLRSLIEDLHEASRAELARHSNELREAMERKVDEVRLEAIRQIAKELNDEEALKVIQEFDEEMRAKLEAKDEELKDSFRQISLLSDQLADLEDQIAEQDIYDPGDAYPTMSATVQLFADLCEGDPIVVHDAALKSAQKTSSPKRREILRFLLALREYALAHFGGEKVRPTDFFQKRGYDYAQGDSESTRNKHGKERSFDYLGERVQMEEHVTLFPNSPNCVSVYWWRDEGRRVVVVGYVGPHLKTVSR